MLSSLGLPASSLRRMTLSEHIDPTIASKIGSIAYDRENSYNLEWIQATLIASFQAASHRISIGSQGTLQGSKRICTHPAGVPAPAAQQRTYRHLEITIAGHLPSMECILKARRQVQGKGKAVSAVKVP
jgi:hypothetical protein